MNKRYHLKNRRRFSTFLVLIVIIATVGIFASNAYGSEEIVYMTVEVQSGDTLWNLAEMFCKNTDIRKYIYEVKKINNLHNSIIFAGELLKLPID